MLILNYGKPLGGISIHAPARGATMSFDEFIDNVAISIHAPARGATRRKCIAMVAGANFNPRTREGCDERNEHVGIIDKLFQSTHPRGVRPESRISKYLSQIISIHAPARGATEAICKDKHGERISIHAPARGATYKPVIDDGSDEISIHAPARGATETFKITLIPLMISIHAPARGATAPPAYRPQSSVRFQSTHPRGVRLFSC